MKKPRRNPTASLQHVAAILRVLRQHQDSRPLRSSEIAAMTGINERIVRDGIATVVLSHLGPVVADRRTGGYRLITDADLVDAEADRVQAQAETMLHRCEALRQMAAQLARGVVPGDIPDLTRLVDLHAVAVDEQDAEGALVEEVLPSRAGEPVPEAHTALVEHVLCESPPPPPSEAPPLRTVRFKQVRPLRRWR